MKIDKKGIEKLKKLKSNDAEPKVVARKNRRILEAFGFSQPPMFPEHERLFKRKLKMK